MAHVVALGLLVMVATEGLQQSVCRIQTALEICLFQEDFFYFLFFFIYVNGRFTLSVDTIKHIFLCVSVSWLQTKVHL